MSLSTGACLLVAAGIALTPGAAAASETTEPTLESADISATLNETGPDDLEASYTLTAPLQDEVEIPHRMLPREGIRVEDLSLSGAGTVAREDGTTYVVTLPPQTRSYTVQATSRRENTAAGDVPIPVPDIPVEREAEVTITATLPAGQQLAGDTLPSFDAQVRDGVTQLTHTGSAVPSALAAPYGAESSPLSFGDALGAVGLVVLAVVAVLWFRHARGGIP